jgi:hypothetical protein
MGNIFGDEQLSSIIGGANTSGSARRSRVYHGHHQTAADIHMRTIVIVPSNLKSEETASRHLLSSYSSASSSSLVTKPSNMLISRPTSLRSMFFSVTLNYVYVIAGTEPLQTSIFDGKPVHRSIYALPTTLTSATQWALVFNGGPIAVDIVQIQACTSIMEVAPLSSGTQCVVICSFTDRNAMLRLFKLDIANSYAFSMLWQNSSMNLFQTRAKSNATSLPRLRFQTELVPIPRSLYDTSAGYTDVVMGVPVDEDRSCIVRIRLSVTSANQYNFLSCNASVNRRGGMLNFVSMAFTSSGDDLFAVDEQPSVWRWKKDAGTASGFSNAPFVAEYVYPAQSSVWKIMLWSNNRLVLVTNTSISLWTQCSPCPAGTVTSNASSADPLTRCCICPAGTFNNLVDFRSKCTPCTAPAQSCTGGFYRTMQDPVCPSQGFTYDSGCARCTTQRDCPPKRLAMGTPCTGNGTSNTISCTTCPNQCVAGTSFVSNDCAIDSYSLCSSCKDSCGSNRYISVPCNIEEDTQCQDCRTQCPAGMYMNQTCDGSKRADTSLCLNCSSITQCQAASETQQYFVDTGMCSRNISMLTVDKLCKPCTVCQPGYWEKKPCTQFSDRECSKCTLGQETRSSVVIVAMMRASGYAGRDLACSMALLSVT